MQSLNISEHFERVQERWVNSSEEERASQRFLQDIASEFLLVIKEANGIYPAAHGRLSEVFFTLGDKKRAQQEYGAALQQNPYEETAWKTRLAIALEPYAGHTDFRRSTNFEPTGQGIVGAVGRNLVGQGYEQSVINEFRKLVETYRQLVQHSSDASSWISMSELMLQMADFLNQEGLIWHKGSWPNLYEEVVNAPWHKIQGKGSDEIIAEICRIAEGRMLLYPSPSSTRASAAPFRQISQSSAANTVEATAIPEEIKGLCWGGFLLHLFWGIGNRVWLALLMLIPYVNIAIPFILLFKGNEWAWRNKKWESVEHFKRVQHNWTIAGLIVYAIPIGILILSLLTRR